MGYMSILVSDLSQLTTYYFRSYARNITGLTYGDSLTFTTTQSDDLPAISTLDANNITTYTFDGIGYISSSEFSITEYGICWTTGTTTQYPTKDITIDPPWQGVSGSTPGSVGQFSITDTTLTGNTMYWYRAYATNSEGTGYGISKYFTTKDYISPYLPIVYTTNVVNVSDISAVTYGNVTDNGNDRVTVVGVCWSTYKRLLFL